MGDNALAAIGAISPLETFINSAFWGYGTGVGIYGYYAGWMLSWIIDGLAGILIYRFGKWRKILSETEEPC